MRKEKKKYEIKRRNKKIRGVKNKSLSHRKGNTKLQNQKMRMHLEKLEVNALIIDS
jgi:hypothetical protein